jgi:hypothetical protein
MEKYIDTYLMAFINGDSVLGKIEPMIVPNTWKDTHPFIKNYFDENENISLNRIFRGGILFKNSSDEPGLRAIDIICNTIYRNLRDVQDLQLQHCYILLSNAMANAKGKRMKMIFLNKDKAFNVS